MTQRNKNLRDVVDNVFRQSSPATPTQIVQDVLSDESRDGQSSDSVTSLNRSPKDQMAPSKFVAPETSITLPAINVTPIETVQITKQVNDSQSFWSVFSTIVLLLLIGFFIWRFYEPIKNWLVGGTTATTTPVVSNDASSVVAAAPATNAVSPRKNVTFDESKNTIRFVDTSAPPAEDSTMQIITSPMTTNSNGATQMTMQATSVYEIPNPNDSTLKSLELSLDNLAKTSLDLQAQRDAAIDATDQRENRGNMRLNESDQYSLTDRMAPVYDQDASANVKRIYDRDGGNNVVGNGTMAPFVTFAPGEEPFDGMVPDYDEAEHGAQPLLPPPLEAGKPHGIMELINDHCMRTGKAMPQAGTVSGMDIMSKRDTTTFAPMRVADSDGHYLQSQKKQFELQRLNASAIKRIYADKRAASAGQILDRGDTVLGQFAGAQDVDAVQYLNINSL